MHASDSSESAKRPLMKTPPTLRVNYKTSPAIERSSHKSSKVFKPRQKHCKSSRRPRKTHPKILGPVSNHINIEEHQSMVSSSPLLALPAELRCIIWDYALTSPTNSLTYDTSKKRFDVSSIGAGLITTCHSVALETLYLSLQLNKLVFNMPTPANVDFLVLLARLNRLEAALGWVLKMDVRFAEKDGLNKEEDGG